MFETKFKLIGYALCVSVSLTSTCSFAVLILDEASFSLDDNGHFSFKHETDPQIISKCKRLASEPCVSLGEAAGGLNQAVDYMKEYVDNSSAQVLIDVNTYTDKSSMNMYNKAVEYPNS